MHRAGEFAFQIGEFLDLTCRQVQHVKIQNMGICLAIHYRVGISDLVTIRRPGGVAKRRRRRPLQMCKLFIQFPLQKFLHRTGISGDEIQARTGVQNTRAEKNL